MNEKTKIEYERLLELFKDVDEAKQKLVDELLKKAAFLKTQLDSLEEEIRKYGCMKVVGGKYILSPAYKTSEMICFHSISIRYQVSIAIELRLFFLEPLVLFSMAIFAKENQVAFPKSDFWISYVFRS